MIITKNRYFNILFIFLIIIVIPLLAKAQTENKDLIKKTSEYFNNIESLKSKFIQIDQNGNSSSGVIFLQRPGKMRIEYNKPDQILIVVDGYYLIYVDQEIDQATYMDINDTPAKYLVDPDWSFGSKAIEIYDANTDGDLINIYAKPYDKKSKERIKFIFKEKPLELRQWEIIDQKKNSITVTLYDVELNNELESKLFKYEEYDLFDKD